MGTYLNHLPGEVLVDPSVRNSQRKEDEPIDKNGDSKPKKKETHHEPEFLQCLARKGNDDIE